MLATALGVVTGLVTGFIVAYYINHIFKEIEENRQLIRAVDKFQAYLGDISNSLYCLSRDDADGFTFHRIKTLLLDEKTRDLAQILQNARATNITGQAMSIIVELQSKFCKVNSLEDESLILSKKDMVIYQSDILKERLKLVNHRESIEVPRFYKCEGFMWLALIILIILLMIIAYISSA